MDRGKRGEKQEWYALAAVYRLPTQCPEPLTGRETGHITKTTERISFFSELRANPSLPSNRTFTQTIAARHRIPDFPALSRKRATTPRLVVQGFAEGRICTASSCRYNETIETTMNLTIGLMNLFQEFKFDEK